jgi:hypothetical protein
VPITTRLAAILTAGLVVATVLGGVTPAAQALTWGQASDSGSAHAIPADAETDTQPPKSTVTISPDVAFMARDGWHNEPVTFTISANDPSGIDATFYRLGESGEFTTLAPEDEVTVSAEGETLLEYYSTDLAGNVEAVRTAFIRIDTRLPTKTRAFPVVAHAGGSVTFRYQVDDPVPGCGRAVVTILLMRNNHLYKRFRVPGTSECNVRQSYTRRCTFPRGTYEIWVGANDIAGNLLGWARASIAKLTVL